LDAMKIKEVSIENYLTKTCAAVYTDWSIRL
jgi:hypothetical protein